MRIDALTLRLVEMPLVRTFRTSSSTRETISHILIEARCDGVHGWGECTAPIDPFYCSETTGTCWHILTQFIVPLVLGKSIDHPEDLDTLYAKVKGNRFAKAGLEMAICDTWTRSQGKSLTSLLGGTRPQIESGVSLGIDTLPNTFDQIEQFVAEGYQRVKLKIVPGHDVDVVCAVRQRWPDLPLQVDANSAYTLSDINVLKELDAFNLLMIEQPLAHDDIIDHASLQRSLRTSICLDESLHSADDVRHALDLGSCRVVNIKVGRVGGLINAKKIHDLCQKRDIPVWCGGMHEFGIGRAANLALASLPGFTLPGDVSGSDKYYQEDVVDPPILAANGRIDVPQSPGLGHEPVLDRIERWTKQTWMSSA